MASHSLIKEFLHKIAEDYDFTNVDEQELIDLNQSLSPLARHSSPSSVSSGSTDINETFPPISPVSSPLSSSTSSSTTPAFFTFSPSLRWLLPPGYDPSSVVWSSRNNTSVITSQSNDLSPRPQQTQAEIEIIANTLFQDIDEEMYNDPEFLDVLQEWYKENKNNSTVNEANP